MYSRIITFTDFLLESERKAPHATGNFTLLMVQIENAAKIIASHVRESGLIDILGATGKTNSFQEEVQKLDEFSNNLLIDMLKGSGQTYALVSEEVEKEIAVPKEYQGEYIVYFDPLDGSSNIDINCPIGTIFSIYHRKGGLLQKGSKQVAAGYILYGSSTMLVFTMGDTVQGFTLDPSIGSFLLSHPNIKIPESGPTYSINEAYLQLYEESTKRYLMEIKQKPKASLRYVGALVADFHRTLLKGGLFLYPADSKHPEGKLRLMLEANPMALIAKAAGGKAVSNNTDTLEEMPNNIHQRVPLIVGSPANVLEYIQYL